ncbi:MAG: SPOR domain-containing protein [Nitrosomonadales bacterium]|nr:SPOR domain-containing protein [Nitrosomonadales bacterium]
MAKQLTDDELNLKRKARRRLIGAVALTLAVVVILPMVLDSEPRPAGQDIDLRIPAPDKVGEFVPAPPASAVAAAAPLAVSAVQPAMPVAPVVEPKPVQATESAGKLAAPAAKHETSAKPEAKPAAPDKVADTSQKTGTAAKPETASKPETAAKTGGSLVVQVGAYSNTETAKQELAKLKKWGFKAYTEKVGDKIRVRVGPYEQREKAEKVRQLLDKHGLHSVITNAR